MRLVIAVMLLGSVARADVRVPHAPGSARHAYVAARRECGKTSRPRLDRLVERYFHVDEFGPRVIAGWEALTDDQRAAFTSLAAEVVGAEERAKAIATLCEPGVKIVSVNHVDPEDTFIATRPIHPDDDWDGDCTELMFHDDGVRWSYDGVWFCGKSNFYEQWQRFLGGGDYATAMTALEARRP